MRFNPEGRGRSSFASFGFVVCVAITAACVVGCGSGDGGSADLDAAGGGDASAADSGPGGDGGFVLDAPAHACSTAADCDGGVCVGGVCCATAAAACGGTCCAGATVCLFDKCVTPGAPCFTGNDCKAGEYCEPALGGGAGGDAGVDGGGDAACIEPPPRPGRCVERPPICAPGVSPDAGTGCLEACEYHPAAGAKLDAVAKWSWGLGGVKEYPDFIDVWATPTVGRLYDLDCNGKIDELDPPTVVFVSGNAEGTCCQCNGKSPTACHTGVLRMLDGRDGKEIWSLRRAGATSVGFMGLSVAIGDLDGDGAMDVAALTGEGLLVIVDGKGKVVRTSDQPVPDANGASFGWGGALAIADVDHDGAPEIAFGGTMWTTAGGALTRVFAHPAGSPSDVISTFVDLDGAADGKLELLVGNVAYKADGTELWKRADLGDGFPAIGDFDRDGTPDVAFTSGGKVWVLAAADGKTVLGPAALPGTGSGGPPTVADFDGDKKPEIGVAMATFYSVMKPNYATKTLDVLWQSPNHDLSSSVTGSSVFDFVGDGKAEVIYNDECFLWVFDGTTGKVRFAGLTTSFTATEASLVADVDGDGRAEMLMVSNGADPSSAGWKCDEAPWNKPDPALGRPAWTAPPGAKAYRGLTMWGDAANAWVGTRTLWSEHTYHVTNVCDGRDEACEAPNVYGSIPKHEKKNWSVPWLNDFRQNVQDKGIFDAPDATVSLAVECRSPAVVDVALRNAGLASLPTGVDVAVFVVGATGKRTKVGNVTSTHALLPGQTETMALTIPAAAGSKDDAYVAAVVIDPAKPKFRECRADNDESAVVKSTCPR